MNNKQDKIVLGEEQEQITMDADTLVKLATRVRNIEYMLRNSLWRLREDYIVSLHYRCDEFDTEDLNGCGVNFDLLLHNIKTDYKDTFSRKLYYSDILLNTITTQDKVVGWLNEIVEMLRGLDVKGE